jgi:hypothetical protein
MVKRMEKILDRYIERMRGQFPGYPPATAHEIASAFLAFKYGLYDNAVRECAHAISLIPETPPNAALIKALSSLRAHAMDRQNSKVTVNLPIVFSDEERRVTAIIIPPDMNDDPGTLELNNALILIYAAALITSPEDEEMLEEHRRLIVRILTDYKKAMGLE